MIAILLYKTWQHHRRKSRPSPGVVSAPKSFVLSTTSNKTAAQDSSRWQLVFRALQATILCLLLLCVAQIWLGQDGAGLIDRASNVWLVQTPEEPLSILWEWKNRLDANDNTGEPRVLVAQSSSLDSPYLDVLNWTSCINQAYAEHYGYDYLLAVGIPSSNTGLHGMSRHQSKGSPHAMLNKPEVLLKISQDYRNDYDRLLILDADAIMFQMSVLIEELLPEEYMLGAHSLHPEDTSAKPWNVSVSATLWNLNHPMTSRVAHGWKQSVFRHLKQGNDIRGEEPPLQEALRAHRLAGSAPPVYGLDRHGGTVFRNYIPSAFAQNRSESDSEELALAIRRDIEILCQQYAYLHGSGCCAIRMD